MCETLAMGSSELVYALPAVGRDLGSSCFSASLFEGGRLPSSQLPRGLRWLLDTIHHNSIAGRRRGKRMARGTRLSSETAHPSSHPYKPGAEPGPAEPRPAFSMTS